MISIIETFRTRWGEWGLAVFEHIQLSLVALLMAVLLAVPLGIVLVNTKRLKEWVLQITGIVQTIPSLALLGLFIPILGIGKFPAITALIFYAFFPIIQSTMTGLEAIDPSLQEAATSFGMTRLEKLRKFELALALPIIVSGIRTSAVLIIGTATLGALIGAGGLGSFILLGIDRNNTDLILIGAISAAVLAVIFNSGIKLLEKQSFKRVSVSLFALVVLAGASLVPTVMPMMGDKQIIIAGKLGPEPEILINLYKELIEAQSDIKVKLEPNFGKTTFLYEALKNHQIDLYPEFSGTIATSLLVNPPQLSNDPVEVYQMARDQILAQDQLAYLEPMAYQNTYALAVKSDYAKQYGLQTISDLKKVESQLAAGFTLEFNDREDGNKGLMSRYGLNLTVQTLEPALRYQAIQQNQVQLVDAYSTDSELIEYNLVTLTDDRHLFPPYQGAPLMRQETLNQYPELATILNQLSGKITAEEMSKMNYQVKVEGKSAAEVAHAYLVEHGLVGK